MNALFKEHIASILAETRKILQTEKCDTLIMNAGIPVFYYADDQQMTFHALPHLKRFLPVDSPYHLLVLTEDTVRVVEVVPQDFWEEQGGEDDFWRSEYDVETVNTPEEAWNAIIVTPNTAFIGDELSTIEAAAYGISLLNPKGVLAKLDTLRSRKTEYEIACIREANRRASVGHIAAKEAFFNGGNELEIHNAFLAAAMTLDRDLPYPTIVALNEKGSILHYQRKRITIAIDVRNGSSLLIDAGVQYRGYASDITRTYASPKASALFADLIVALDTLQKELVRQTVAGVHFIELHHNAHLGIAAFLKERHIITIDGEEAVDRGITRGFLPHGLGHMLGIQVHDVGNATEEGMAHPLREYYPKVRTNMKLENTMVTTIEPGIYFNEILLAPHRTGDTKNFFNWTLVDELISFGGIRIEDDIVVTEKGPINLTREFLP